MNSREPVMDTAERVQERLEAGAMVGRYVILQPVAGGGMGLVYAAYDPKLERKVALKLLRPQWHEQERIDESYGRLQREAQALARVSHPNVVAVHDVGTFDEQIFLAMELVDGVTVRDWLERGTRTWREILAVFVQAGRGLAAAHAVGVTHRDFKPDNVILGNDDRVRVVDFGLARTDVLELVQSAPMPAPDFDPRVSLSTLTRAGTIVGTPAYMAPEQRLGEPVDGRADQFSFCVALYEALYGELPFRGQSLSVLATEIAKGRVKDPPKGNRSPGWVRRALLRGLHATAADRYATMDELLDVLSRDRSIAYRRLGAMALGALLVIGAAFVVERVRERRSMLCSGAEQELAGVWNPERRHAVEAAFRATGLAYADATLETVQGDLDRYGAEWTAAHVGACEATRVRGEQSEAMLDKRMGCLSWRLQEVRALVDVYATADARVVRNAVQGVEGLTSVDACSDLLVKEGQYALPADPAARARAEELRSKIASGDAMLRAGHPAEARPVAEAALTDARALQDGPLEADAAQLVGMASLRAGDVKSAETQLPQAAVLATLSHSDNVLAQAFNYACFAIGHEQARYAEGRVWCELALAVADGAGDDGLRTLVRGTLGDIQTDDGEYDRAIDTYKQVTAFDKQTKGASSLVYAADLNNIALAYRKAGRYDEALAALRESLAIKERAWGPVHPSLALSTNNIGMVCYDRHDDDCALDYYGRALQMLEQTWGPKHLYTGLALTNVGTILEIQGKYDEALADFQKADGIWESTKPADHPDYALLLTGEARAFLGKQMPERALPLLERALAIRVKAAGILPKDLARTRFALARALWGVGGAARDKPRARVLALQAREAYAALGEDQKAELAEVDDWLGQHPG